MEGHHERHCIGCGKLADVYCIECDHFFCWTCYNHLHGDPADEWVVLFERNPNGRKISNEQCI